MSWVGTGRCLTSLDFSVDDYRELGTKLVNAATKMQHDAWWLSEEQQPGMEKAMQKSVHQGDGRQPDPVAAAGEGPFTRK